MKSTLTWWGISILIITIVLLGYDLRHPQQFTHPTEVEPWQLAILHKDNKAPKPNNQYEILVYQNYYILKDGNRVVDSIPVGVCKRLDHTIELDNQ